MGRIERTRRRGRRARYARLRAGAPHANPSRIGLGCLQRRWPSSIRVSLYALTATERIVSSREDFRKPLVFKRFAGRSRSCAMVFTPRCYWPRRTDDSYQDIVAAGANGLGPSVHPQPTTTLSCSVLTAKFFPPTSLGLDRARPTGAFKSSVTRMHGKAARPGKTIGFLSRENYYFPRPQSLSILPNSTSPFTLRASLKAFGQSSHLSPTELRLDRFRSAIGQD